MYASDYDEPPANLELLVEQKLISRRAMECPSMRDSGNVSYFYHPPDPDAPINTLMACDLRGNHKDHRNVLTYDGRVRWVSEQEFQGLLQQPENADFARALREAEGP